ncbi:PD40 domain-containing protein [candidate division WOR-3 bacterium]|nr:PD40 domain-containing protein [candidate division WOR-3 bacterium]
MRYSLESLLDSFSANYFKFLVIVFIFLSVSVNVNAQYFGKNKIKTKNMSWQMIVTDHFQIYYYQGGEYLAQFASNIAEDSYKEISDDLSWKIKRKTPILIYNSHSDFEQTNVLPYIIDEQIGGFTEIFKSRIVIPFDGSYENFRHVINHELTHAFQFDILYGKNIAGTIIAQTTIDIPLWFIEGMAEYESRWLDPETDIFIRDLIINGRYVKIQDLWMYGGYLIYKEGQMIVYYLTEIYGRKILGDILFRSKTERGFEKAIKSSCGLSLADLDIEFQKYLRKRYWKHYDKKSEYTDFSIKITKGDSTYYKDVGPAISPDGNYIAFYSDRTGRYSIFLKNVFTNDTKLVIGGERTKEYEQMHILRPHISWLNKQNAFVFITKSGESDCIHIYDIEKQKVIKRIKINLDAMFSPSVSKNDELIAFAGINNGMEDIYICDLKSDKKYKRLTYDKYDDKNPLFINDSIIVFISDRPDKDCNWQYGKYRIYTLNLNDNIIKKVSDKTFCNISRPTYSDKYIYFTSNDEGFGNIFKMNLSNGDMEKISDVMFDIGNISVSSNGKWFAFDGVKGMRRDIYLIKNVFNLTSKDITPIEFNKRYTDSIGMIFPKYKARNIFSIDVAMGYIGYSSYGGVYGQGAFLFSDLYGDNELMLQMDLGSYNILDGNYYLRYMNYKGRFNKGIAVYKFNELYYYNQPISIRILNNYGTSAYVDYPFDKFTRIETNLNYDYYVDSIIRYDDITEQWYIAGIYTHHGLCPSVAFVYDNALIGYMGGIAGNLFRIEAQRTVMFNSDMIDYYSLNSDYRHYVTFANRYTLATRLLAYAGGGRNVSTYTISGTGGLRAFDYGEVTGTYVWLFQNELRFVFLKDIIFDNPIPFHFGSINSALFMDIGSGFSDFGNYTPFERSGGFYKLKDIKADIGVSLRLNLGIALIIFDISREVNLFHLEGNTVYSLSLGGIY